MSVPAIILAAGASRRLGHPKQLVRVGGETLLGRTIRLTREAGASPIFVVLGAHREGYGDVPHALRRSGEYRVRIADGSMRVWLWRAYSIGRDANGLAVNISMAIDLTEQRASHEALARSEAQLQQALRSGGLGLRVLRLQPACAWPPQ